MKLKYTALYTYDVQKNQELGEYTVDQEEIFAYENFNQSHEYLEVFLDRNPGKNT